MTEISYTQRGASFDKTHSGYSVHDKYEKNKRLFLLLAVERNFEK